MAKKNNGTVQREVVGLCTSRPIVGAHTTLRIGSSVSISTTDCGVIECVVMSIKRNATGLTGVNNIGPGHLLPSFIVTVGADDYRTGFKECFLINESAIDSIIFRETTVDNAEEEVQMSME